MLYFHKVICYNSIIRLGSKLYVIIIDFNPAPSATNVSTLVRIVRDFVNEDRLKNVFTKYKEKITSNKCTNQLFPL